MSLSRAGIVTGMVLLGTLALHQQYLSQQDTRSQYYWRNFHAFSDMVFQIAHYKHVDHLLSMSKVIAGAEFGVSEFIQFLQTLPRIRQLKKLFDKFDDKIDNARAEDVLSLGQASPGNQYSPFLLNLFDDEDKAVLDLLVHDGLITEKELAAFCNLLAHKLYSQAELSVQYAKTDNTADKQMLRKQIAKENIEISGCYMALVIHFIRKDPRILQIISKPNQAGLTYQDVKSVYEYTAESGELMQIAHDIPEFRFDLRNEKNIGKISANYFLAEIDDILQQNEMALRQLPDRAVNLHELPKPVQNAFAATECRFFARVGKLKTGMRAVYSAAWSYEKLVGFFSEKPRHHAGAKVVPRLIRSKL